MGMILDVINARENWEIAEREYQDLMRYPGLFCEDERAGILTDRETYLMRYRVVHATWVRSFRVELTKRQISP